MKGVRTGLGIGLALMLAACGGGKSGPSIPEGLGLPLQIPRIAHQAPRVDLRGRVRIGADVAPPTGLLTPGPDHGETRVAYGMVRDGVGAQELTAYLQADAAALQDAGEDTTDVQLLPDGLILRFGMTPPTIRLAAGTSPAFIDETLRVVQAINRRTAPGLATGGRDGNRRRRGVPPAGRRDPGHFRPAGSMAGRSLD